MRNSDSNNDKVVSILNDLIETNLDRIKGYEKASQDAEDGEIKSLCSSYASQSRGFKVALEAMVRELGGKPQESSSAAGAVYRAWMGVKHTASDSKKSVLSSCEFGEDAAVKSYEDALDNDELTQTVISLIDNQYREILKAHDKVKFLRDSVAESKESR